MLQIHNVDNSKADWNINETHIIIPMIEPDNKESDKILTSTLTLNSLEGGDQEILTNGLEHSLVIGLDKTLFETSSYKSDLVIIQNSDLKNPVAYALSYIDQDKNEILWHCPSPKDKICASNKTILEVRDILNYDMHELEKNEQVTLGDLNSEIASQVTKNDGEILTSTMVEGKKEPQCNGYYSTPQNSETVSISPQFDMTKFIESEQSVADKKILEDKSQSELSMKGSDYGLRENTQGILLNVTKEGMNINNLLPMTLDETVKNEKNKILKNTKTKDKDVERKDEVLNNSLYEESLPLKKKAKMKRTLTLSNSETQKSLLKDMCTDNPNNKYPNGRKVKQSRTAANHQEDEQWSSDSNEPLINKVTKRKSRKMKISAKKCKRSSSNSPVVEEHESNKPINNSLLEDSPSKADVCEFDIHKFKTIYDLTESLRKCRMINGTVWQTLHSGLKEMKVDILKEMNAKKNEESSPDSMNYSPQLKAFALILYFKQPAAFNHLAHLYKAGWPTLNIIKEWKRRLNNHQRPNFVRIQQKQALKP